MFEETMDPYGYLILHGEVDAVQEYVKEFFHEGAEDNENESDDDEGDQRDKSEKTSKVKAPSPTIAQTRGVGESCRWTDSCGIAHEMVIIPASKFNTIKDTETADKLSAAGSAKVTEKWQIKAKDLIGMPAYIQRAPEPG
jgi:hypothetical protein